MRRILAAIALTVALVAPALYFTAVSPLAQTALPPPGQIGHITYNQVTVQEGLRLRIPYNYGVDAGSTDDYVATIAPVPLEYVTGGLYFLKAATANTGAATVNFNALGVKTIVKAVNTTLANNDILANMLCIMLYDGINMVLLNPRAL